MGLLIYWYDAFCFAIVAVAMFVSVYMLWIREWGGRMEETIMYHTRLLVPRLDTYLYTNTNTNNFISWSQLWSSCWRGLHPAWLLGFRLTSLFLLAALLSWDIHVWGASIFIYYTEWTFVLVMLYFAIGSVISAYGCWLYSSSKHGNTSLSNVQEIEDIEQSRNRKGDSNYYQEQEQTPQRAGFWGYLMQIVYQTCAGAVILTDVVFWGIIVPLLSNARLGLNLLMGCMHTVNAVLLLVDTSINGLPFPWFRLAYFVLWSSAYVVFQWLIHLFGFSWWPYPFLELSTPSAPLSYSILAVSHIACYGFYALIVRFKDFLFSRIFPDSYIRLY